MESQKYSSGVKKNLNKDTSEAYSYAAQSLIVNYEQASGQLVEHDVADFLEYIEKRGNEKKWRSNTRRFYRSALRYFFKKNYPDLLPFLENAIKNGFLLVGERNKNKKSAQKYVDASQLALLQQMAVEHPRSAELLVNVFALINTGVYFGLRVSEWHGTKIEKTDDDKVYMVIPNGKYDESDEVKRGFAPYRRLEVNTNHPDYERLMKMAEYLIDLSSKYESKSEWKAFLKKVSGRFSSFKARYHKNKLKSLSIYSGRHQFAINARSAGFSLYEIAAMMGHANIYTNLEYYGRKSNSGKRKMMVSPSKEDVEIVKRLNSKRSETHNIPDWFNIDTNTLNVRAK